MAVNAISPKYFPLVMSASTWSLPCQPVQEVQVEREVVFDFTLSWDKKTEASLKSGQHECMLWIMRFKFECHFTQLRRAQCPCPGSTALYQQILSWWWLHLWQMIAPVELLNVMLVFQRNMHQHSRSRISPSCNWRTLAWFYHQGNWRARTASS